MIDYTLRKRRRRSRCNPRGASYADNKRTDLDRLRSPKISVLRANVRKIKRKLQTYNYAVVTAYSHKICTFCGKDGQNPPLAAQDGEISVWQACGRHL